MSVRSRVRPQQADMRTSRAEMAQAIAPRWNDPNVVDWLGILPNPDRILRRIGRTEEVFEDIATDAHVASVVGSRKGAVLSREWAVQPASARRADRKAAEMCEAVLGGLRMRDILATLLDAPLWGRAYLELRWEYDGAHLVPTAVEDRPQRRFAYGNEGELRVLTRQSALRGELVPERRILTARAHPTYDNPYGDAAFSRCFWPWSFKKGGWRWWTVFVERYGMPWIVGKAPRGASDEELRKLDEALAQAVVDAVLRVPENTDITLIKAEGTSSSQVYDAFTSANNQEISKAVLGQTLTTEMGKTGSYAAANVHNDVRGDITDADAALVADALGELFRWITEWNIPGGTAPSFLWVDEDIPQTAWVGLVRDAAAANLPVPLGWALQRCGIPERQGDEPLVGVVEEKEDEPGEFADLDEPLWDPLENREALDWLRTRVVLTADEWQRLTPAEQPRAFTVQGIEDVGALEDLNDLLYQSLDEGATMRDWQRESAAKLTARGLEPLPAAKAETVFRTNAMTALSVGRYQQMSAVVARRPFWQYRTADDDAVRDAHRAMDGKVFRADDAIWQTWYPPNGFNCRCDVRTLSQRELDRKGLTVENGRDVMDRGVELDGQVVRLVPDGGFTTNPALAPAAAAVVQRLHPEVGPGLRRHLVREMAARRTGGASVEQIARVVLGEADFTERWASPKQRMEDADKLHYRSRQPLAQALEDVDAIAKVVLEAPDDVWVYGYKPHDGRAQFLVRRSVVEYGGRTLRNVAVVYEPDEERVEGVHVAYTDAAIRNNKNFENPERVRIADE